MWQPRLMCCCYILSSLRMLLVDPIVVWWRSMPLAKDVVMSETGWWSRFLRCMTITIYTLTADEISVWSKCRSDDATIRTLTQISDWDLFMLTDTSRVCTVQCRDYVRWHEAMYPFVLIVIFHDLMWRCLRMTCAWNNWWSNTNG